MSYPLGILVDMDAIECLAEGQHGLVAREQALAYGMTRGQIDTRLRSGRWELAGRAVYRVAGSVPTWEQRILAAVLAAGPGSAACRRSAAALWRIPGFRPGPIEVIQTRGRSPRTPGKGLHDSSHIPHHQIRDAAGVPVTCPERTLLDLCGCIHPQRAERALDNCLAMDATTVGQLGVMLAETGARGRPGTALLRRLLAVRTADYVPPASELEALLLAVVAAGGLDPPARQEWVGGTKAPVGRVDFVYREARVVIEADSRRYHSAWLDVQADHRRDLLLTAAGWRVLRVNWHQLVDEPGLFLQALLATLARPAA